MSDFVPAVIVNNTVFDGVPVAKRSLDLLNKVRISQYSLLVFCPVFIQGLVEDTSL
jgi:hypothetical protein